MMLFDELRGMSRQNPMFRFYQPFIYALDSAIPFEIDAKVAALTQAIKHSPMSQIENMGRFCRVPFKSTWVEWAGSSVVLSGDAPDPELERRSNQRLAPPPRRFGALITAIGDTMARFSVSFAWCHANPAGITVSPFMHTFDHSAEPQPVPDIGPDIDDSDIEHFKSTMKRFSKENNARVRQFMSRAGIIANPYMAEFWTAVESRYHPGSPEARSLVRSWLDDIQGEGGFIEALLIVMNSRNLTTISEPVDMTKVNKNRRIMGRPPLASFRSVTINLSKVGQRKADAASEAGHYREHLVRGHFKIRKSGIFWWSPFVRGDAALGSITRTKYEVRT